MEAADRIRQALDLVSSSSPKPISYAGKFEPWSQQAYLKRLFTFDPNCWTPRRRGCEATTASRYGWKSSRKLDQLQCSFCTQTLDQPWIQDICLETAIELEKTYRHQFVSEHKSTCPWISIVAPFDVQFLKPAISVATAQEITQRSLRLQSMDLSIIPVPTEHDIPMGDTLAITGWDVDQGQTVKCIHGCCQHVPVDKMFDPVFEHRWCCPMVLLDDLCPDACGWKAYLAIYRKFILTNKK